MTEYALPAGLPVTDGSAEPGTGLVLFRVPGALSRIGWCGPRQPGLDPAGAAAGGRRAQHRGQRAPQQRPGAAGAARVGRPLAGPARAARLPVGRPAAGSRLPGGRTVGRDWSPAFVERDALVEPSGGSNCAPTTRPAGWRCAPSSRACRAARSGSGTPLTNQAAGEYVLQGLDVMLPVPDRVAEILDLTGRWGRERAPQRHPVRDGIWLREARTGRPGPESATLLSVGTAGFGFGHGEVWGVHLAWSGNGRYFLQRLESGQTVLGAGELLLPGELVLADGESYATPWVFLVASADGLDGLAEQLHGYTAIVAGPSPRPATGGLQRLGGGLLRPRPGPAAHAGRPGRGDRRRAVRAGRRLVRRPPQRPGRPGRLDRVGRGLAGRSRPADRARPGPGHELRAVVRTGDGQPGLRAVPGPSGLGAGGAGPAGAAAPQPAGARPRPARGARAAVRPAGRGAARVPDRLREVGPQPAADRRRLGGPGRRARRACPDPRLLPAAGPVARRPPGRRVGELRLRRGPDRPGRAGTQPSGCGPRT